MDNWGGVSPAAALFSYWADTHNGEQLPVKDAKVIVLAGPQHGGLQNDISDKTFGPSFYYSPNSGYLGKDSITFFVEVAGKHVKVVLTLIVDKSNLDQGDSPCPDNIQRLNSNDAPGMATDLATWLSTMQLGEQFASGVTLNIADLPAGAIGQTVGTNITLDTNAAGHNWFIDTTPWSNEEYLPTADTNVWQARAGSAAAGKMDMLSVLLHEYGHVLGIEHSADQHASMATTLTPGTRRLPSADEMALMQELIGQAKDGMIATSTPSPTLPLQGGGGQDVPLPIPLGGSLGLSFLGFLRGSRFGGVSIVPDTSTLVTRYAVSANASFTNLDSAAGWNTQGSVNITPSSFDTSGETVVGSAILNEISTGQTRLSQVFLVGERDRYLSFTLSGTALDDLNGAPDDAFEVALLNANTGTSLLGGNGLTRSDALLNLQGDGTEYAAVGVTRVNNADGSRTYRVDLSGIASGTAVNLLFDLIGFGVANSSVTLSDIRVSGLHTSRGFFGECESWLTQ